MLKNQGIAVDTTINGKTAGGKDLTRSVGRVPIDLSNTVKRAKEFPLSDTYPRVDRQRSTLFFALLDVD